RRDALSLLFFSLFGALTVQFTFLMTIEKSSAATATVLQFLSPTIIVAWFALARKARPTPLLLASFFVGAMMGMGPLEMVNAIESGIGGTLGFLAAVIGL
ncbi:EamA family transporter, partial [Klebsiella pneumoniae]|nr:EamA family transporter [Klebsiella pneumoniae]